MRTQEDINSAKEILRKQKETLPEFDIFGDSNFEALDAAMEVLDINITSEDEIYDKEYSNYVESYALNAVQWLNEEIELDDWID